MPGEARVAPVSQFAYSETPSGFMRKSSNKKNYKRKSYNKKISNKKNYKRSAEAKERRVPPGKALGGEIKP